MEPNQAIERDWVRLSKSLWPPEPATTPPRFVPPDFADIHEPLRRKGVTRRLLWEEYCQQHLGGAYQYTQFYLMFDSFLALCFQQFSASI